MLQLPMFAPPVQWTAPEIASLPRWQDHKSVAVDIETCDPELKEKGCGARRDGYIAGISFAIEDGPAHYLPVAHMMGGNLDRTAVIQYLRDQAATFTGTIVLCNGPYDLDYLWNEKIVFDRAEHHRDVQIAEPLLDENQYTYGLDAVARRHGLPGKDEEELRAFADAYGIDPKSEMYKLPAGAVARYAIRDVTLLHELRRRQETRLQAEELWTAYNTECKVALALLRMRRRGVAIDFDRLDGIEQWARQIVGAEQERIRMTTGINISPSFANTGELARALQAVGVPLPTTASGKPSVKGAYLATIDHPIAKSIKRGKEFAKLLGTFCKSMRTHSVRGRIHTTFHSLRHSSDDNDDGGDDETEGAAFGRCSSSAPNLQQQPIRNKEYGKKWRTIFKPDGRKKWWKGDFSQQEPRWFLSIAEQLNLPKAAEIAQKFRDQPSLDSYAPLVEISGCERDDVKIMFLARSYGSGRARMARQMKLPTVMKKRDHSGDWYEDAGPEAGEKIDRFDSLVPYIKILAKRCEQTAKQRGYVFLYDKRRCRFVKDQFGNIEHAYAAGNRVAQGNAALQTKYALLDLEAAGCEPQLVVHDEFDGSEDDPDRVRMFGQVMRDAIKTSVPAWVDMAMGPSYGELEKI